MKKSLGGLKIYQMLFAAAMFWANSAAAITSSPCPNCSVSVTVRSDKAWDLIHAAEAINSMPLTGFIVGEAAEEGFSIIEIHTYPEYAERFQEDSFDVARKVSAFTGETSHGIKDISAKVEYSVHHFDVRPTALRSGNAGTIGH